jgi:hypothetical protein
MPVQSSFAQVASQIVTFNRNIVESLSKINALATTTDPSVNIDIIDIEGVSRSYSLPSFSFLKSEIERLNNSINSMYSIEAPGALIQTTSANKFRKIVTVDLNREPNAISDLGSISEFKTDRNWFFDGLLNPLLSIELDLSTKVEDNVRKMLSRRYMVEFAKNPDGTLTTLGQSALNSFNTLYRGITGIDIAEFENWHKTTPGLLNPLNPNYDEQMFDLLPNVLLYDGVFSVLKIEEDTLNRKLWYHLNTTDYIVNETLEVRQLAVNDELIINQTSSNTRYKITEISTSESNVRVRLERVEGLQPIPVAIASLKIYSPVVYRKRVKISVGYNERNVLFIKPVNADLNLVAKDWSAGTGFFTNDLRLASNDTENGYSMEQYYTEFVYDYGEVLQDFVQKKVPNKLAGVPNIAVLNSDNFKVVQINRHLTDTPDANSLINKNNYANSLKDEITQIESAVSIRKSRIQVIKFPDAKSKKSYELEISELESQLNSKSTLLSSLNQEILSLSKSPSLNVEPKFRLRGFWGIPEAVTTLSGRENAGANTLIAPQEVIQFRVQYRYVSKTGSEPQVETFSVLNQNGTSQTTAAFSNWNEYKTDVRKRIYDEQSQTYFWQIEDIESADTPNINQIDIPISANEQVEIRMKSISEVGWPESPVESDWSEILTIPFPDDLNNVLNESDFILQEASREELKITLNNTLDSIGIREHLANATSTSDQVFFHSADKILSGFKDENGIILSLLEYLTKLENRVETLEERIRRVKGDLEVIVYRLTEEFVITNNSETGFVVELEDYLDIFIDEGVRPVSRRYINRIYSVVDFRIKIRNKSFDSPLGLLSNRFYSGSSIYNSLAPQVFWVNNSDELLFTDVSGSSKTQLNNQFIWCVNYDAITQNSLSKLSENIGNSFLTNNSNSLTNKLSLPEYNLGYSENTALAFVSSNESLRDSSKWIDVEQSESSNSKLLTTIHPVVESLDRLVEDNDDKVKTLAESTTSGSGAVRYSEIDIPIKIYFKINALNETTIPGSYVDFDNLQSTIQHTKKLKFFLEDENQNRPFVFTLKFTLNRNKVISPSRPRFQITGNVVQSNPLTAERIQSS